MRLAARRERRPLLWSTLLLTWLPGLPLPPAPQLWPSICRPRTRVWQARARARAHVLELVLTRVQALVLVLMLASGLVLLHPLLLSQRLPAAAMAKIVMKAQAVVVMLVVAGLHRLVT
jgi:hypothetical protein